MKRTLILISLLTSTIILLITAARYCYVSGNTFTMPSGNKENNPYHTYNIDGMDNKTNNSQSRKQQNSQKENSQTNTTNNNTEVKPFYNNTGFNKNKRTNNKQKNNNSKHTNKNIISTSKPVKKYFNKTRKKPSKERDLKKHNPDTITKIEFQNHFIKIKTGTSINVLFKTNPEKHSHTGMVYKSYNKSIAVYKNNKLTAIKKGFTTILIMLKDGTVKAACPVKVI